MVPKLYKADISPPVRAVLLTAEALGIKLEHIDIDILDNEYLKSEFVKVNPQHCVPTLEDNGVIIWDSHAINGYLVTKYGKIDALYPKDPLRRAVIDQRLHFDSCNLFGLFRLIVRSLLYDGEKKVSKYNIHEANLSYDALERFLKNQKWAAGDDVTIADFSLITTITGLMCCVSIDSGKYPNILRWIENVEKLPYYNVNIKGLNELKAFLSELL